MTAHSDTLTLAGEPARAIETLTEPNRTVLLLLAGGLVVEGWMSRNFERALGRVTYWTWDPAFCTVSQPILAPQIHALADRRSGDLGALPDVSPVVMAGCVEPVAWAPLPGASVAQCQPRPPIQGEQRA